MIWSVVGVVASIGSIAALAWFAARGHGDRDAEDAAREFLDRHGRWPTDEEEAHFGRTGRWPTSSSSPAGSAGR